MIVSNITNTAVPGIYPFCDLEALITRVINRFGYILLYFVLPITNLIERGEGGRPPRKGGCLAFVQSTMPIGIFIFATNLWV